MQPAASAKAATEKKAPAAHPKPESPAVNKAAPPDKASVGDRKRRTIYFTEDVDKRLRLYVAAEDAEMSAVVTQAVEEFLNRQQGRA
jgi:hypothetical protein